MKRDKKTVELRNRLGQIAFSCECGAVYDGIMTDSERNHISEGLKELVKYIDEKIK